MQGTNRMYKPDIPILDSVTGKPTGLYREVDTYSTKFYAYEYAKTTNITLEGGVCTDHYNCGTRCCLEEKNKPAGTNYC